MIMDWIALAILLALGGFGLVTLLIGIVSAFWAFVGKDKTAMRDAAFALAFLALITWAILRVESAF